MRRGRAATAVFDVPLVRAYQDGSAPALDVVQGWVESGRRIGIGVVSALDLLARSRDDRDRADWRIFLDDIALVLAVTEAVVVRADLILRVHPLPCALSADDALVAATAVVRKLPLYALDPARYAGVPGLTVLPAR